MKRQKRNAKVGTVGVNATAILIFAIMASPSGTAILTTAKWTPDDFILPEEPPASIGSNWAYDRMGLDVWQEDDPNGIIKWYKGSRDGEDIYGNQWYQAFGNVPGPKPTPRKGACMVSVQNNLNDGIFSDQWYSGLLIIGGEDPITGVPIGEANLLYLGPDQDREWLRITYTYPEPVSYAACARRTWNGNPLDPEGINGATVLGGKKNAAGDSNDDVWFLDTDAWVFDNNPSPWYFIADEARVRRYGAAFVEPEWNLQTGETNAVLIWGGVGPGLWPTEQRGILCSYEGGFNCNNVVDAGEPPLILGQPGFIYGAASSWSKRRSNGDEGFLFYGGSDGYNMMARIFLATLNGIILTWTEFGPSAPYGAPLSRYYAGMSCADLNGCDIADVPPYEINPTRYIIWSGRNDLYGDFNETWQITFGGPWGSGNPGPGPPGCPKCPPPEPW